MSGVSRKIDRFGVVFDEGSLVADAGLLAAATLLGRLGVEDAVDRSVRLGGRPGGAAPGRKVLTLVSSMTVGGTHIDHVDRLRAGATGAVLGFGPAAPSTVGTFLRSFTWAHARRDDRLTVGRTVNNRLLGVPGRIVNRAGRITLRLPARWPWATAYQNTLTDIRALPRLA